MQSGTKKRAVQEGDIPGLAKDAVRRAYDHALASGSSVLEAVNGKLVKSNPDGSRRVLKDLEPGRRVIPGTKIRLGK